MANRYDIVRIDFQANARGANAAIESLRQEAEKSNAALTKTREEIDRALKANAPDDVIAGLRTMAKTEERRYKQLSQAQNELIKGMRVLDQGVKMFNDGSLNQMNAAFQKAVNNAATLAQSKFGTGTKEWREMGAIMQETQQNYARMQRDTDQLIQVIQQGGTVFRSTLEQEKKGIQELMGIVPYMGSEYQKLEGQLQVVTTKLEQMATAERQMKGEIVTSNDARRVAYQLTEEGAAAAKREAEAAEQTIAAGKERISVLEKERKTREDAARATAETVAKRNEDLAMQQNVIASIEKEIANEDRKSKKKREAADVAKQVAESSAQAVETEKAALEGLQATTKAADEKVKQLQEELTKLSQTKPKVEVNIDVDAAKKKIEELKAEQEQLKKEWMDATKERYPHQTYSTYDEFVNRARKERFLDSEYFGNFEKDYESFIASMQERRKEKYKHLVGDEVLHSPAFRDREQIAKNGFEPGDSRLDDDYLFGAKGAKAIMAGEEAYLETCKKVESAIRNAHEQLRKAFDEGIQPEQVTNVGKQIKKLESLYLGLTDINVGRGSSFWGSGKDIVKDFFGEDVDKQVAKIETQIKRMMTLAEKSKDDVYAEKYATQIEEALKKQQTIEERQAKLKQELAAEEAKLASAQQQSTKSTQQQTETIKQQTAEQKTLKSDIDALTGTIKELKKQRDELTAAQKEGAKSTEGEAQSAQDLMTKMKSLNDEIEKQKKKLVKPEQDYQKELRFAATAKKPEDRDRLAAEAAQKLDEKTEKTRKKIQELSKQLDETRDAYKALTKEEESAANAAGSETEAVQKLTQARDRLKEMTAKSTFHESVSGERTITNPREAENYLLSLISANGGTVSKTQSSFPVSKFDNIRKAFGERYGMEKAEAEKWLKELISKPHDGIFTKAGGKDASGSYYLINNDVSKRLEFNKEKMQASKDLGATSLITDPAEIEKAYQAALKQLDVTEQQAVATEKLSEKTKQQTQATEKQVQTEQKQNEVEQQKATLTSQINALEEQKKQKQEQLRQLQQQSAEDERKKAEMQRQSAEEDKKKAELQKQLKDAQKELTNAQKEEEQQQKKLSDATAKANADKEKSVKMEEELTKASADKTAELEKAKKTLGEMELATEKDIELNNQRQKELQETNDKIAAEGNTIREAETKRAQAQTNSIKATEDAIRLLREENNTIEFNSEQWRKNAGEIQRLEAALGKMKGQATLQMMTDRMVQVDKLSSSAQISESALKAQEAYWRKLIDDPRTASDEAREYESNLERVHQLQQQMVKDKGQEALRFFVDGEDANASANTLEEQVKNLKAYRDSLPKERDADVIKLINEYIQKTGEAAKVASGEMMRLEDAEILAGKLGKQGFSATTTQLQQAKKALVEAQNAAGRGEPRFTELQSAINKVNLELAKTGNLSKEVQSVLDSPKGRSFNELKQAVEQGRAALQNMSRTTDEEKKDFDELAKKIKEADFEMRSLGNSSKGTASAFDKAWSRLKTYIGLYVGAAVAMQKLTATMGDLIELSDKMGEVRKTTGFTADEVGRLSESLKKMDTRTSINGLLELSVAAGQLGLKTQEDVQGFTEAANKLMVALPEMGREGATEMLKVALATGEIDKIRKQMQEGIIDGSSATAVAMEKVGSTIDRLRATSAATAPAITDFVKRVGAVGAQSGISIDQVAALGSTVDALGMRVEMSATALSRMIPAIKNNAFDVAHAIGVTPDTLRNLFETGRGMEAILMIFQHIKDSGMGEDDIESMLGMGNMKEIMKELNQQGARAGIVFAGLSQNVDELRRQLGVAGQAYEENIAIQQEYDKMNETTAAKWERLKNQLEEFFVGDQSQRWLGGIIDGLRGIVDLLTGNGGVSVALRSVLVYLGLIKLQLISTASGALKAVGGGLKNIGIMLGFIKGEMTALQWGNIFTALAGALSILVVKFARVRQATQEALAEQGKYAAEIVNSEKAVEDNFKAVDKTAVSIEEANKKLKEAQAALEKARKEMDGSKESADRLTKAEQNLKKAEDDVRIANDAHRASIEQINKLYGKYLGFMLSEISSAAELANARELINSKLRETITLKRKEAALGRLEENLGEDRDRAYGGLSQMLSGAVRRQITDSKGNKSWATDQKASAELLRQVTKVAQDASLTRQQAAEKIDKILIDAGKSGDTWASWRASVRQRALEYQKEYKNVSEKIKDVETQFDVEAQADREESQKLLSKQYKEADKTYAKLEKDHADAQGEARKKAAADLLKQSDSLQDMVKNAKNYYDLTDEDERKAYDKFVKNSQARIDGIESQRNALLKEAGKYYKPMKGSTAATTAGGGGGSNVWGSNASAESTDYSLFDVNELVARRNQMDKFKNILKPDTDVRAVLAEDKALMKALDNGLQADWKSVLNWYNTERKKIQAELKSERFSTNMGHWRDETTKKGRRRVNPLLESDYALAELDRYYSRRKEKLEKARIEENMSEELFNRQADLLEQEHLERRSKLRETFTAGNTEQEKKMVTQFRLWWKNLEDSGELDEVPWATVESEWSKATAAQIGRNNLKAQQDLTQLQQIIVKHMNEIAKLIDKERPFDSITANLRKNLTEMDILLADLQKDGPEPDTAKLVKAETVRLKFLLSEAERAYSLTFDELKERMIDEGFGEWAAAVENDEQMKQSLLQNLRNAYDAIQDAIKKESNIIKKQLEIQWNDVMPGNDKSIKDGFEKLISDIGLSADSVKRANSLIGAGTASERVADKLAIQQMRVQLQMQETYFAMMQKIGLERIKQLRDSAAANERESVMQKQRADQLRKEGKLEEAVVADLKAQNAARQALQDSFDAEHAQKSLNLATTKELTEEEKQRVAIANQLEESQNRLYTELKSWADLLSGSLQSVFEASHAGEAEYYNELAKLNLTGKGGPGAGTYVVIENEGTEDAAAHYEYLDEREALERQLEIERQNAQAEAWEKVMDDINMKMSETITDLVNASLQNASVDANTDAIAKNTDAIGTLTTAVNELAGTVSLGGAAHSEINPDDPASWPRAMRKRRGMSEDGAAAEGVTADPVQAYEAEAEAAESSAQRQIASIEKVDVALGQHFQKQVQGAKDSDSKMASSNQSAFAKMTQAMNLYGIAYQAMSNENMSATQKFEMIAIQAAGQAAITSLTTSGIKMVGDTAVQTPSVLAKIMAELGPIAGPIAFASFTALLGGLMGIAMSKLTKSKSQIASVTGAGSAGAGRLSTGMLTYAAGNVNEFTDPATLTPGRQYNVDAADGKTYRARYMGRNPRTHLTNGPEFHLSGEKGKEMIIDAGTTRQITMNDNEIWRAIQTLSSGGRMRRVMKRGRGVPAFADGNVEDFEEMLGGVDAGMVSGMSPEQMAALQASIDRQSDLLDRALTEGIKGVFNVYGPDGLVSSYDQGKKTLQRHGERR